MMRRVVGSVSRLQLRGLKPAVRPLTYLSGVVAAPVAEVREGSATLRLVSLLATGQVIEDWASWTQRLEACSDGLNLTDLGQLMKALLNHHARPPEALCTELVEVLVLHLQVQMRSPWPEEVVGLLGTFSLFVSKARDLLPGAVLLHEPFYRELQEYVQAVLPVLAWKRQAKRLCDLMTALAHLKAGPTRLGGQRLFLEWVAAVQPSLRSVPFGKLRNMVWALATFEDLGFQDDLGGTVLPRDFWLTWAKAVKSADSASSDDNRRMLHSLAKLGIGPAVLGTESGETLLRGWVHDALAEGSPRALSAAIWSVAKLDLDARVLGEDFVARWASLVRPISRDFNPLDILSTLCGLATIQVWAGLAAF
jgi:hypothetical protein